MTRTAGEAHADSAQPSLRRLLRFLVMALVAAGALATLVAGLVGYSASVVDRLERENEHALVTRRVERTLQTLRENIVSATVWNEAYERTLANDQPWMQLNYGDYYADYLGHDVTVAFDGLGQPIYASRHSALAPTSAESSFIAAVAPLVASIQAEEAQRRASGQPVAGLAAVITRRGIVSVAGAPYFVAVSNVIPEDAAHGRRTPSPLVASGKSAAAVVPGLARDLGLRDPRLTAGAAGRGAPVVLLRDPHGRDIGGLAWTPLRPGGKLLMRAVPALSLAGGILLAALLVAGIYVHRLIRSLARYEAALTRSLLAHDRVWRNSRDLLVILEPGGVVQACNPAWPKTLGQPAAEVAGRPITDFGWPGEDTLATALAAGSPTFEARHRHADGSARWIAWRLSAEEDLTYAYGRDITDEKAQAEALQLAQDALRQAQKLDAMGQLTGGVAHDFNNLLTPIIGSLDMLERCEPGSPRAKRLIENAALAAERARVLVQRLLSFARRQPLQPSPIDVAALVRGMGDLLASTLGPQVTISYAIADDLPAAVADANQLELALLNLSVNAKDAMPGGGALLISARAEEIGDGKGGLAPGDYVRLSVADTGIGMDEATMKRAVEPFFSTKGVGRGTGLGLSMVHGLALQLGGELRLGPRAGGGTQVDLWLPACPREEKTSVGVAAKAASASPADPMAPTPGLVLLVEDEEAVRANTADMLSELGYAALHATSAAEALRLLEAGAAPDILLTDHMMPGMTGADLARTVRGQQPGLPILLVSGFADGASLAEGVVMLTKPFRQGELQDAIEAARRALRTDAAST